MEELLKKYDKMLTFRKLLDGSTQIIRQSPFDSRREHILFVIKNKRVGSAKWVLQKLISMDTTRHDLVGNAMRKNWALREKKDPRNMHEEIADFMLAGGSTFIN